MLEAPLPVARTTAGSGASFTSPSSMRRTLHPSNARFSLLALSVRMVLGAERLKIELRSTWMAFSFAASLQWYRADDASSDPMPKKPLATSLRSRDESGARASSSSSSGDAAGPGAAAVRARFGSSSHEPP